MAMEHVKDLLEAALLKRQGLKGVTNAMRVVNSFGDGMEGLVLEQYDRHCAAQVFDRRRLKHAQVIIDFVKDRLNGQYLIVKERIESASSDPGSIPANVWLDSGSSRTVVEENGLKFGVDLDDTLNSGLFLDMRSNRKAVAGFARGRRVLNCFSYTCSFGVYCRAGGAAAVVNVDVSRKSLERGARNYALNGLTPEKNELIRADAVEYLERAGRKDNRFDLIILDPPSFARYEGKAFSVKKDLAPLVALAMKVLNPGGILFVATNFSAMSHENIEDMIIAASGKRGIRNVQTLGQDVDFVGSGLMQESYLAAVLAETCG